MMSPARTTVTAPLTNVGQGYEGHRGTRVVDHIGGTHTDEALLHRVFVLLPAPPVASPCFSRPVHVSIFVVTTVAVAVAAFLPAVKTPAAAAAAVTKEAKARTGVVGGGGCSTGSLHWDQWETLHQCVPQLGGGVGTTRHNGHHQTTETVASRRRPPPPPWANVPGQYPTDLTTAGDITAPCAAPCAVPCAAPDPVGAGGAGDALPKGVLLGYGGGEESA